MTIFRTVYSCILAILVGAITVGSVAIIFIPPVNYLFRKWNAYWKGRYDTDYYDKLLDRKKPKALKETI